MSKGFTIIELVISIFVLSIAIIGIFSAFSVVTILTSNSVDGFTGTYLAQEGMEIVRNIRDTNWLNMDTYCASYDCSAYNDFSWVDGLNLAACSATGCEADYTTGTSVSGAWTMSPWASRPLLKNTNGFYNYTSGANTKFKRKIIITKVTDVDNKDDHIIKVIVKVSWDEKATILNFGVFADTCGSSNCITAEETLYNWYNYVNQ